jgi:hypothetical protein
MNKIILKKDSPVSSTQLHEFFLKEAQLEKQKIDGMKNVMGEQMKKATEGKSFVIHNNSPK